MTRETFEAGIAYEGERLDKYLNLIFSETDAAQSRSFFQKLIKEGHVLVNDTAQKANYRLKADDMICVEIPDAVQTPILPENIPLDILYEDDDLLVVNKPKGMVVHPSAGHYTGTLVNASLQGQFVRHQRGDPPGYRTPYRYGYNGFTDCLQK